MKTSEFVLTFSCDDHMGIVQGVSTWLLGSDCNIIGSSQFGDAFTGRFFMRVHFSGDHQLDDLRSTFRQIATEHGMDWELWDVNVHPKVLIMCSKPDHCIADLLYRAYYRELPIDIALIVSNHRDNYGLAARYDVDFVHLPISKDNKPQQEARLYSEVESRGIDFMVLARYMQILSNDFCAKMPARIINIHHSFLPSFKGAKPYHQAHERGVKLIGATAHYVTPDLDEGPIIDQGIERVDHRSSPADLAEIGRDVERLVLARAVRYQAEHRILLNDNKTVVFN